MSARGTADNATSDNVKSGNADSGNTEVAKAGQPGGTTPNSGGPDAEQPTAEKPNMGKPNTEKPDTEKPGTGKPDNGERARVGATAAPVGWAVFAAAEPGLAEVVEQRFGAFTHHVLVTLRKDGAPRTSGLEVVFRRGELWLGMMPGSLKARDLRRDPRFALQANPGPGTGMGGGDVRISGRAIEVEDAETVRAYTEEAKPPEPFHLFRAELTEVVRTSVEDDRYLVVQLWRPGAPVRTLKRT